MVEYNPKIPIILDSIRLLYALPHCSIGGNCHIVTDDHNLTDQDLQFVIDECNDPNNNSIDKELSKMICELLLQLSFEQRCVLFYMINTRFDIQYWSQSGSLIDKDIWEIFIDTYSDKSVEDIVKQYTYW